MKKMLFHIAFLIALSSCTQNQSAVQRSKVNWSARSVVLPTDSLVSGSSYLSVYSEVHHLKEGRTHDLTATVSMRNPNPSDTVYVHNVRYFNSQGKEIRSYFEKTIFIAPMETVQIVIEENDREGGSGPSFLFDWNTRPSSIEPLFEGVMISTSGQQGLSFTTVGVKVK